MNAMQRREAENFSRIQHFAAHKKKTNYKLPDFFLHI